MHLNTNWSEWSAWKQYTDNSHCITYKSRRRYLRVGKIEIGILVESDSPHYGFRPDRFFMFCSAGHESSGAARSTVYGPTAFRTVRQFIREFYK